MNGSKSLMDKCMVVMIGFHRPGTKRRMSADAIESDADKEMLRASKIIFESETLNAIRSTYGALKRGLRRRCLPLNQIGGAFLVPMPWVEEVDGMLKEASATTRTLAKQFAEEYPELIRAAKKRLRSEFNPDDYVPADRVEREFGIDWSYVEFTTPTKLRGISSEMYQREVAKAKTNANDSIRVVQDVLRLRFAKLVDKMVDKLTDTADGERKVFRDSTVDKMTEFLDDFKILNVADDDELAALVAKARGLLKGVDADALRDDEELRGRVSRALDKVQDTVSKMVTIDAPRRRIKVKEAA